MRGTQFMISFEQVLNTPDESVYWSTLGESSRPLHASETIFIALLLSWIWRIYSYRVQLRKRFSNGIQNIVNSH